MKTKFSTIYLLHGKGGSPTGSVLQLEQELLPARDLDNVEFERLLMPHADPAVLAEESVEYLREAKPQRGALIVGISLGGLVAAKLQENGREDLHVICISSPVWADGVRLMRKPPYRIAFFSSRDEVIAERVAEWPRLAEAYDLSWLTHDTDRHKVRLARLIQTYTFEQDISQMLRTFDSDNDQL